MAHLETQSLMDMTRRETEAYITAIATQRIEEARAIHPSYATLWQRVLDTTVTGGKRFRPYLVMVGYGDYSADVLPVAVAQELIHAAMLVHDDIIDRDTFRRGHKNITGLYCDTYGAYLPENEARHYADSVAVVAGDALISEAFLCISSSTLNETTKQELSARLHTSIFEVIGGELTDVEAAFVTDSDYDPLDIYRYKTAGYGFIGPLLSGAICAGADESIRRALESYGTALGAAFQLQDDILGVFGDEQETGKSTLSDLREAKATYLIAAHKRAMNQEQSIRFGQYFGNSGAKSEELEQLRQDLMHSGARQETEDLCETYYSEALRALDVLSDDIRKKELIALVHVMRGRKV